MRLRLFQFLLIQTRTILPNDQLWIDKNYKDTQNLNPSQPKYCIMCSFLGHDVRVRAQINDDSVVRDSHRLYPVSIEISKQRVRNNGLLHSRVITRQ